MTIVRHTFRAMGTDIECLLERPHDDLADRALAGAEAEFFRLETCFSRFLPTSDLSLLNAAGEAEVGADLLCLVEAAVAAREETQGRFDPTIHDALLAAGYDRSFELLDLPAAGSAVAVAMTRASQVVRCGGEVHIDRERSRIRLAAGTRLDLGGIAKGHAADRVSDCLAPAGPCLVSAGGDIAVRGEPSAGTWAIAVPTPDGGITLGLSQGGLATSGVDRRHWRRDGVECHHVIDPAIGLPAVTDLLRVTVTAGSAREAETRATSLLLAGDFEAAGTEADAIGMPCVLVGRDGRTRLAGGLR